MMKTAHKKRMDPITIAILVALVLIFAVLDAVLYFTMIYDNRGSVVLPAAGSEDISSNAAVSSDIIWESSSDISLSSDISSEGSEVIDDRGQFRYQYAGQNFTVDLTAFEQYMNPDTDAYLILVNAEHPLSANDIPDDLTSVVNTRDDGRDTQKMRLFAEKALEALFLEAKAQGILYSNDGYRLSVTSAYRSYASQQSIFNGYVDETMSANPRLSRAEAEELVIAYSSRPGTSEHQSGLCCDMHNFAAASSSNGMREKFAANQAGVWLTENCAKFGFILRYPDGKQDKMCGVGYESWHFRYVGRYHAIKIMESGLCLEEYMETLG